MDSAALLFWVSLLILGYTYFGYPALLRAWAVLRSRPPRLRNGEPSVSVVVVAYNEAERIEARLENLLSLDYPRERFEVVLASDGSTDATAGRARAYEIGGVKVLSF